MPYKDKEKQKACRRASYQRHKEKQQAKNKEWFDKNKERALTKNKEWVKNNPEKILAKNKRHLLKLNLANKNISIRTLNAWSVKIRERDTACLYCGSAKKLQAHHILSKSKHPEFALFLNNGITLCEVCHFEEHRINGEI